MSDMCYNCGDYHLGCTPTPCKEMLKFCPICTSYGHNIVFCPRGISTWDPSYKFRARCQNCDQWHLPQPCQEELRRCVRCGHLGHKQPHCPLNPPPRPHVHGAFNGMQGMRNTKRHRSEVDIGERQDAIEPLAADTMAVRPDQISPALMKNLCKQMAGFTMYLIDQGCDRATILNGQIPNDLSQLRMILESSLPLSRDPSASMSVPFMLAQDQPLSVQSGPSNLLATNVVIPDIPIEQAMRTSNSLSTIGPCPDFALTTGSFMPPTDNENPFNDASLLQPSVAFSAAQPLQAQLLTTFDDLDMTGPWDGNIYAPESMRRDSGFMDTTSLSTGQPQPSQITDWKISDPFEGLDETYSSGGSFSSSGSFGNHSYNAEDQDFSQNAEIVQPQPQRMESVSKITEIVSPGGDEPAADMEVSPKAIPRTRKAGDSESLIEHDSVRKIKSHNAPRGRAAVNGTNDMRLANRKLASNDEGADEESTVVVKTVKGVNYIITDRKITAKAPTASLKTTTASVTNAAAHKTMKGRSPQLPAERFKPTPRRQGKEPKPSKQAEAFKKAKRREPVSKGDIEEEEDDGDDTGSYVESPKRAAPVKKRRVLQGRRAKPIELD